jgi:hypothetical protein
LTAPRHRIKSHWSMSSEYPLRLIRHPFYCLGVPERGFPKVERGEILGR